MFKYYHPAKQCPITAFTILNHQPVELFRVILSRISKCRDATASVSWWQWSSMPYSN